MTATSVEEPESTSMVEGPDASLACELVGADEGLTEGVVGAIAGDASRCSMSLMVLEAPNLEVFLRLVVAFFLKRAKCVSTGARQINRQFRRKRSLHKWGCFGKGDPGNFSLFRLQGGGSLLGGSTLRLLLLASVGSVRGGALPLSCQWSSVGVHDGDFLHLWIIYLRSHAVLIYVA